MTLYLSANPQFYDYLHRITLHDDGYCEFADGGGQRINLSIEGTYKIIYNDDNKNKCHIKFKFFPTYE